MPATSTTHLREVGDEGLVSGYAPGEDRPIGGYAILATTFAALATGATVAARRRGVRAPDRIGWDDLLLAGIATHKLSRLLAKEKVTSFLRAPFTRYRGGAGRGELDEEPRGTGLQRAVGELLLCPYCLSGWISAGFVGGLVVAPRATRTVAAMAVVQATADTLQIAYRAAGERA